MELSFWKYFRKGKNDNYNSLNYLLNKIYSKIGEHYSDEIKGNTSRNKGIKKIISHCKLKYGYEPTGTEIKTILKTKNYKLYKVEFYKIPYKLDSIFKSIVDLSLGIDEISSLVNESIESRNLSRPISSCDILIPGILDCIEDINTQQSDINIFSSSKNKILDLGNNLVQTKSLDNS